MLFGFGQRDLRAKHHWRERDFASFRFRKDGATLICFEGNGTIDPEKINAGCKRNETLMGIKIEETDNIFSTYKDVDVLGFYYPQIEGKTVGEISEEGMALIVDKFMTLCTTEDGALLTKEEMQKNFSRLVFSSHCDGAVVVDRIFYGLNKNLRSQGMSQGDILDVFAQTAHISYAPHTEASQIPMVRVESFTDSVHRDVKRRYRENYGEDLDGIKVYYNKPGHLNNKSAWYAMQESVQVFSSRLINTYENTDLRALRDEHEAHYLIRDEQWRSAPKVHGEPISEHAVNLDTTSQMMGYALAVFTANAIANANSEELIPNPSMESLATDLQNILDYVPAEDLKAKEKPQDEGVTPCQ